MPSSVVACSLGSPRILGILTIVVVGLIDAMATRKTFLCRNCCKNITITVACLDCTVQIQGCDSKIQRANVEKYKQILHWLTIMCTATSRLSKS